MKASEFVSKLKDVAENYKTLYVMGCFGAPMNAKNKKRYCANHEYNKQAARVKMIEAASSDTFGFDCVCLIKGILWGWNGDKSRVYGGAAYGSNGVQDVSADGMIKLCKNVTTDFSKIEVGEAVWCKGHIGVYIGNGLAVECTPSWKNRVQITAVKNIGTKSGYSARTWTKHGKLPYIEYDVTEKETKPATTKPATAKTETKIKVDAAQKKDKNLAGTYKVTASALHIRAGAGTTKKSLGTLKSGTKVKNYGFYSVAANSAKWLYVKTTDGTVGFCSARYLKKC
jgi:hypothetical protein